MIIVLVQPTAESPSYLKSDYWDVTDKHTSYETYAFYNQLDLANCRYDIFSSFKEAEDFVKATASTKLYKRRMLHDLDKLKNRAKTFNWAVA
ncbi:hypothetical protein EFO72_04285 [Limosilactobacillus reuteri]|nr:hypothetical protein [Limosilactobacillus reuteri]MCT3196885.1 hypothetical protein [Limosilactobacillus reuteri]